MLVTDHQPIIAQLPLPVAAELIDAGHATLASPTRGPGSADSLNAVITVVGTAGSLVSLAQAPSTLAALARSLSSWWDRRQQKGDVPIELVVKSSRLRLKLEGDVDPDSLAEFLRKSL